MPRSNYGNTRYSGPKRRIEKVVSKVTDLVSNAQEDFVLHTAEDKKTLVRTIISGTLTRVDGAANNIAVECALSVAPQATVTHTVTATQALDQEPGRNQMWGTFRSGMYTAGTLVHQTQVEVDISGQRKLDVGDEIVWSHIATVADVWQFTGIITMFFKE